MVCAVCKVSPQLVQKFRAGKLTGEGQATLRVHIAEMLLSEKLPALLQEVERLLPMHTAVVRASTHHTHKAS